MRRHGGARPKGLNGRGGGEVLGDGGQLAPAYPLGGLGSGVS